MRDQFCFGSVVSSLGKLASEKMGILDLVEVLCSGKEYNELNVRAVSETFCKKLAEGGSVDDLIQMVGSTGAPIDPSPISYPPGEQEPITLFGLPVTKPDVFIEALSKAELTTLYFLSRVSNKWLNMAREAFWKAITREVKSEVDGAVIKIDITIDLFLKADGQDVAHLGKAVEKWDELQYMYSGGSGGGVADKFRVHVTTVRQLEENDDLAPVRDCIERIADVNGETPGNLLLAVHAVRAVLHGREKDLSVPAFYSNTLPAIEVPAGFTTIGDSAFSRCSSLASIELPASLTTIGESAFEGCSSLASIELPASITSILHSTFCRCSSLASVELPAGLTSIGFQVFWGCSSLQSIQLPAALRSIGVGAFEDCSSLSSIKLPASLTTIGNDAFSGCSSLASVVGLPASLTTIADRTFRDCSSLASIKLPANLTTIGENAFFSCSSLASINCPTASRPSVRAPLPLLVAGVDQTARRPHDHRSRRLRRVLVAGVGQAARKPHDHRCRRFQSMLVAGVGWAARRPHDHRYQRLLGLLVAGVDQTARRPHDHRSERLRRLHVAGVGRAARKPHDHR